jgi:hypothetical protein
MSRFFLAFIVCAALIFDLTHAQDNVAAESPAAIAAGIRTKSAGPGGATNTTPAPKGGRRRQSPPPRRCP